MRITLRGSDPRRASVPARAVPVLLFALAALLLAACGSSSGGSATTTTNPNASAATANTTTRSSTTTPSTGTKSPAAPVPGRLGKRFTAVRECLQKARVELPTRKPGQTSGTASPLPKGVTHAQYEAAVKKCGGFAGAGRFRAGAGRISSPAFKQALAKFASCMRENGIDVPPPDTSGNGPIFSTKGLDIAGAKFRAAQTKCAAALRSTFRSSPGAAPTSKAGARAGATSAPASPATPAPPSEAATAPKPATPTPNTHRVEPPNSNTPILAKFTACMRANGIADYPQPQGSAFPHSDVNMSSPQFKAAEAKCVSILQALDPKK